jgi:GT2 family glycosyltransferase
MAITKRSSARQPDVSIIIVHYRAHQEILDCLQSFRKYLPSYSHEIIIVDNDLEQRVSEDQNIKSFLKQNQPKSKKGNLSIKVIENQGNSGFGAGSNLGADHAQGKFLFFLNPDTVFVSDIVSLMVKFLEDNTLVSVVAPVLLNKQGLPYPLQGCEILTPLAAVGAHSLLHRFWPNNPIARKFWQLDIDHTHDRLVAVVPGSAFMIRRDVFDQAGGFDEKFFLYFEEHDLCKRVVELGGDLFMMSKAQLIHHWGVSTKHLLVDSDHIYRQSRYYYFTKHYGKLKADLVEVALEFSKWHLLALTLIVIIIFLALI